MFQERTITKEEAEVSEIRQNRKEEHDILIPSNSKGVRVVQRIVLSPRQLQLMFQERVIKSINYREIARKIKEEYIPESAHISFFRNLLMEEIEKIDIESFSHGKEIKENYKMLSDMLYQYVDANWQQIIRNIQTVLNNISDDLTDIDLEEEEAVEESISTYTIIYHTGELEAFCEEDSQIMGTIANLRNHYHGTPQALKIDGESVLHQHVTDRTAIAFRKYDEDTIEIMAYGIKSDSTIKGSGGYTWDMKPK